jgi:hypothetical protein
MNRTFSDEDRRAVDLFLDQGAGAAKGGVTKVVPLVSQKRMASVLKILALLDELPAQDPPPNLVEKTMRRIDRASGKTPVHPVRRPTPIIPPA